MENEVPFKWWFRGPAKRLRKIFDYVLGNKLTTVAQVYCDWDEFAQLTFVNGSVESIYVGDKNLA